MTNQLSSFSIYGLHGISNYSVRLNDNKVIIVGENGSGKTTIFRMMYYALSCDWDSLRCFDYDRIVIAFKNGEQITIESSLLKSIFEIDDIEHAFYYFEGRGRNRRIGNDILNALVKLKIDNEGKTEEELDRSSLDLPFPYRFIKAILNNEKVKELCDITKSITSCFESTIVFLPTYRRIEEQLKSIFPNFDKEEWNKTRKKPSGVRSIELIEFGMADVEESVKNFQDKLNSFSRAQQNNLTLGYLSEIIDAKYEEVNADSIKQLTSEQVSAILMRIQSSILSKNQKDRIVDIISRIQRSTGALSDQEKIVCHYFLKLIDFDKQMSDEETALKKFIEICNKYLVNNVLKYDSQEFSCKLYNKIDNGSSEKLQEIHFQNLSSGEKQIVSLFSHLNISQKDKLFVFIDEPELSLSVDWQRMFLVDIINSQSCVGLIATTHSPFVFENELEQYVHGINEFRV